MKKTKPEGYIEPTATGFDYVYQYKNHLGNVRLSYSDMNKDGVVAPMATSPYGKGSLTYRISNLDGSTNISPVGGLNKNGKSYMEGIFLHRTNWSGKATRSSQGCLCIDGRQWKGFESQLGKMKSFRIRVTR